LLDAPRLGPTDDATSVTAAQLRGTVQRLTQVRHWQPRDPDILIVMDSGYDVTYLSHALADLPVVLVGPGQTISIGGDRGLSLDIHVREDGWLPIQVGDPDRLTTALGTRPQEDWTAECRRRLEQLRLIWPRDVIETAPGAYEWAPIASGDHRSLHPTSRFQVQ